MNKALSTLYALPLALALTAPAWAQQTTATLTGIVTDSSGAPVDGVRVKATSTLTNTVRETTTNDAGSYTLPFLSAGEYTVETMKTGFQSGRVTGLALQVGVTARVDIQIKVGSVSESIDVTATGAQLQTENATVGSVIDSQKIVAIPLNGRNFIQLAQLIPGAQAGTPGSITVRRGRGSIGQADSSFGSTGFSANGSRDTANRFFLDGIEVMDYDAMTYSFSPSVDSLAEFKVETSSYSAESGGAPGGHINMLTKRGGNQFHGTLWEFNRNDALTQTYDAIANTSLASPRLNRNQYGANIGGPVLFPKIYNGKDKTFFFFNWESGRNAQGSVAGYRTVPTADFRNGDFSKLVNPRTGQPIVLRDPQNVPIANNIIPKSALSAQALAFIGFTPLPNTSNGALNYINNPVSAVSRQDNYNARIDHQFSSKDSVFGRFVFNDTFEAGVPYWGNDQRDNLGRTKNVSLGYTRTVSASIVNDLRGGYHNFYENETFGTTGLSSFDVANKMGLPLVSKDPKFFGPPVVSIGGNDGSFSTFGLQRTIGPRERSNGIYQFVDTLSWQKGRHFMKMGADIARRSATFNQARDPRGTFTFDGTYTGSAMADFMLGYVRSASLNPAVTVTDLSNYWQSYFFNDDFKLSSRLTLNFGIRYDYFGKMAQTDDRLVNIEQNGLQVTGFSTPKDSKYGRGLLQPDKNNWGPRIGFAYQPGFAKDMVIRGGYGMYYTPQISNAIFAMAEGAQATAGAQVVGNITGAPNLFFNNPFAGAATSGQYNFAVSNDQNMRDSYIQQWNFNIQKKLIAGFVLDVGYVGSKGTRLVATLGDLNRPIAVVDPRTPGLASLNARRPNQLFQRAVTGDKAIGNSTYNSLQVKVERRMATGITVLSAFTWSRAMTGPTDIGGQVGGGNYIGSVQDLYNLQGERSIAGFDQKYRSVNTILYELPFLKSRSGALAYFVKGWQVSTIITAQTGFGAPISYGVDTTGTGVGSRPDVVAGQNGNLPGDQRTWKRWFNTDAFTIYNDPVTKLDPFYGRFGTSPRTNAVRLPGMVNTDFSANKRFSVGEQKFVEFRTEVFNLFNHYNPDVATVDLNIRSQTFGTIGGGVRGTTTRVIQLGAKFVF
ncbi:MAG TPA: carboxypeptidase-like regulatory domain-containing protein [Bryobacteraceae bacterium]|nr:carboxypeptidase-like regulatory domain-containing protein [Bryobacteraceae bacterium]